jgi:hypothetical protein
MSIFIVPLSPRPAQTLAVNLGGQSVRLNVYFRAHTGLLVDVLVLDALIIGGVQARDRTRIVRDLYLGFIGELAFVDQHGHNDPQWRQLGQRYLLFWYSPDEVLGAR